ncbi:MAG: hypothetical protein EA427_11605 [Spirochaetaceae bacterium]|nr:MAG: hypothetical protein EA427_11605 [Spirochaetaceae bacterium]
MPDKDAPDRAEQAERVVPASSRGFLKVSADDGKGMPGSQRAALVRRGNELFNAGNYDTAKRIFLTVRYSDGLIRLGNHYMGKGDVLEAFRMFWIAGDSRRVAEMTEQMAMVVRKWLREER